MPEGAIGQNFKVSTGPLPASRKVIRSRQAACRSARRDARDRPRRPARRRSRSAPTILPAPIPTRRSRSISAPASRRCASNGSSPAAMSNGMSAANVRPEDNGLTTRRDEPGAAVRSRRPPAAARQGRQGGIAARLCARRHHHAGDGIHRHPRESRPRESEARSDRRELRRLDPRCRARRNSCATRSRAAAPSFPRTSITRKASR